ncbi:ABC-F family ATP-binding cassette domain-containing protein [Weissella soli]|jgi:ATPase subunit of ABC transporter with duplicated ATPase domains|uniref:ATPase subunit of ABC transporter with duplicated ATPase domains n=2 Tax=Weissella soli TaxID=155866 RepID=A0A288Q5A2_9LACO|nr:ATP-binding cassette domain-containing protein [Weissella soli]AOT55687.1 Putative ribose/galactose/methyl galactoside import ATP-binding protein [Weissella soli]NKY83500.1 ATP-binding cassette domain-containing protein [Weissella soli]RDL06639.1 ATPase subunit of ABC transporter with duplicated ATPase domains [Weissella soli]GEN93309.1 ABC-F family ATPase [Weissella soli]GJM47558.1 ABC-F family ATPase [Weissella soli]
MLTVSNVSVAFSGKKLYDDVNLKFTPGNTYGVIGANGAGKSTFLKVLEGKLAPTTGTVSMDTNERMSSLVQNHFAFDEFTVLDTVLQGHQELYEVKTEMDAIYLHDPFTDEDGIQVGELSARFEELDGWNAETEALQLLRNVGISDADTYSLMGDLPETTKVKVLLAQALFGSPDILILDEPTNGLDTKTIAWLEDFLADYQNTVIVVSHDRHFLNAVSTMILDVDFGKIKLFVGNYDFWKESSELALRLQSQANSKKEEQIKQLQEFIARFSANASKSKQATSRKKQLDKITLDDIRPSTRKYPYIKFDIQREIGNDLLRVEGVSKTIDGVKILDNITFTLSPDDKTLIMAQSDATATVLLDILAGRIEPDTGTVTWGVTTSRDYLAKDMAENFEKPEMQILDFLRDFASKEENDNTFLRGLLGRMLFKGEDSEKSLDVLSGGEKVRVMLSKLMLTKANVLILDDPTNHLDLESITSLNDGLVDYKGSLIFTSHDHTFAQTIANHVVAVSDQGSIDRADMTYEQFMNHKEVQKQLADMNILL